MWERDKPPVLLMLWTKHEFARRAARGAGQYAREHGSWQPVLVRPNAAVLDKPLAGIAAPPAGVIGFFGGAPVQEAIAARGLPAVNVSARLEESPIVRVIADNRAAGRLAAEHLLDVGFRRLAFVGGATWFSRERCAGFVEAAETAGAEVHTFNDPRRPDLGGRLARLRPPVGVLGDTDQSALLVQRAVLATGRRVPEDVAVVGVDNTDVLCDLAPVPLSSVDTSGERTGYRAAEVLDALLRGEPRPAGPVRVAPERLVVRASSGAVAVEDPFLRKALRTIRERACEGVTVEEVVRAAGGSRRALERQMKRRLGRTPHQEIRRVQFERARELLAESRLKLSIVARRSGFGDPRHFLRAFREAFGMTPGEFRKRTFRRR